MADDNPSSLKIGIIKQILSASDELSILRELSKVINDSINNKNTDSISVIAEVESAQNEELAKVEGGKRKPSKYNIFMKKELERLKKKDPSSDHKQRFKDAVKNWNNNK